MNKFFSSVRLERGYGHDHIGFWQGGEKCGVLAIQAGTGERLIAELVPLVDVMYEVDNMGSLVKVEQDDDALPEEG